MTTDGAAQDAVPGPDGTGPPRSELNRRSALLQAALDLFATRPYDAVSVDDICSRASVAHGLVSYHFGGKRQLFAAAVRHAWDELLAYEKPLDSEVTAAEKFRGHLSRHFEYFRRHPERFRLMTRAGLADDQVAEVLKSARRDAVKEIEAFLGCPQGAPPRLQIALSGWAGFLDTVTLEYVGGTSVDIADITNMCTQVLVASIRSASDIRVDSAVEQQIMSHLGDSGEPPVPPRPRQPVPGPDGSQ